MSAARLVPALLALLTLLVTAPAGRTRDSFAGTYSDESVCVVLEPTEDAYAGTLSVGGRDYPLTARAEGSTLRGTFLSGEQSFELTAVLEGDRLVLTSGGATYRLRREASPAPVNPLNPLAPQAPQAPEAPPPPAPRPPAAAAGGGLEALRDLGPPRPDPAREWTIVLYMTADNDLETVSLLDLNEMEAGMPERGVEMIVLCDRAEGYASGDGDWQDARVLRIRRDDDPEHVTSPVLARPGELDMGDPATVTAFLAGALEAFPAPQHMFTVWDHGGGWASQCMDLRAPGSAEGHDSLTLVELRRGIEAGLAEAGLERLEILGFDECLMGQLETAVEMAPIARVSIASEALVPGLGLPYTAVLPVFARGTLGPRRIAEEIVRAFHAFYTEHGMEGTTLSAVDLDGVGEAQEALDRLLAKLQPSLDREWPAAARALFYAERYIGREETRSGAEAIASIDLLDALKRLRYGMKPFPAEAEFRAFVDAMDRCVIASAVGPRRRLSNGVAIYAPQVASQLDPAYSGTRFAGTSRWPAFLASLHRELGKVEPPRFSDVRILDQEGRPLAAAMPLQGHQLAFTLEGDNIIWTQWWDGVRDPQANGIRILLKGFVTDPTFLQRLDQAVADDIDLVMPQYVDGRNELTSFIDAVRGLVSNGRERFPATLDAANPSSDAPWRVPALYSHPSLGDEPLRVTLYFHDTWWEAIGIEAYVQQPDGRVMPRLLEPSPDAKVTLLHEVHTSEGKVEFVRGGTLDWGNGLHLALDIADPGDCVAVLVAETMGEARSVQLFDYRLEADPRLAEWSRSWAGFRPEMLEGTWEQFVVTGDGTRVPTQVTSIVRRHPQVPLAYVVQSVDHEGGQEELSEEIWIVGLEGYPCLRVVEMERTGLPGGMVFGPAFLGEQDGQPVLTVGALNAASIVIGWKRTGAGGAPPPAPLDAGRFEPLPVPEPEPVG